MLDNIQEVFLLPPPPINAKSVCHCCSSSMSVNNVKLHDVSRRNIWQIVSTMLGVLVQQILQLHILTLYCQAHSYANYITAVFGERAFNHWGGAI